MNLRYHFALVFLVISCLYLTCTNTEFRIINGFEWDIAQSRYLVAINYCEINICVGSLITMERVVTACHCMIDQTVDLFTIIAGVTDIRDISGQSRDVKRIYFPCEFRYKTGVMDIAIVQVDRPFDPCQTVEAISFCETGLPEGAEMRVSGWGFTTNYGYPSPTLKSTILHVTSFDQCAEHYLEIGRILSHAMICAAFPGTDVCSGDSGAPGVVHGRLCAVVSRGNECNDPYYPCVFTNITDPDVQQFIKLVMRQ